MIPQLLVNLPDPRLGGLWTGRGGFALLAMVSVFVAIFGTAIFVGWWRNRRWR
jgi:hypothetical protein